MLVRAEIGFVTFKFGFVKESISFGGRGIIPVSDHLEVHMLYPSTSP